MDYLFFQNVTISLILGVIIGLQREISLKHSNKPSDFGGARTFGLISLFGFLSTKISDFVPNFILISMVVTVIVVCAAYIVNNIASTKKGVTTEFAAIIVFAIGVMVGLFPPMFAVVVAIMVAFILNLKDKLQEYESQISRQDLNQAVLFMMMTFVILPILPNSPVDQWGLFNLYQIWLMVVLIAGISFFGYICTRFFGSQRGLGLTGFFGGLVSSTAIAYNMSRQVGTNAALARNFGLAVMLASSLMLFRAYLEVKILNDELSQILLCPVLAASAASYIFIAILYFRTTKVSDQNTIILKNPFELNEALLIGVAFGVTLASITLAKQYFGDSAIYAVSFLSGLVDIDATVLSVSSLANTKLSSEVAINAILLTIISNTLVKIFIVTTIGGWNFAKHVLAFYIVNISVFTVLILGRFGC